MDLKEITYKEMMTKKPEELLNLQLRGMLPKNSLGRQMLKKVRIYKGTEHNHEAQTPEVLDI